MCSSDLALRPDSPDVYANLGYIAIQRGRDAEAEQLLKRSVSLDAKLFPPRYDLGRLLLRLKRYEEAVGMLRGAAALNDKDPGVHYQLFLALSRLKKTAEAKEELALFQRLEGARQAAEGGREPKPAEEQPLPEPSVNVREPDASRNPNVPPKPPGR